MISNKLGEFIRKRRGDMSLRDFAKLCGLSHTHLDSIEKGVDPRTNKVVRPTVDTLNKIATGSGIDINELIQLSTSSTVVDIGIGRDISASTVSPQEPKKPKDLLKFLDQSEVMFDGETYKLDEEDKQKLRDALEYAFWHAKQKNKRKK